MFFTPIGINAYWLAGNAIVLLIAYLLGSLPTGYLLGKWLKGIDIRNHGSGSTGATNVLRTLGKGPGTAVLLIDVLKGVAAIAVTQFTYQPSTILMMMTEGNAIPRTWFPWMMVLSGLFAILGHSKSIWLKFTGGKSVATSLGILLMLNWQVGLATFGIFLLMLTFSRMVSLSSISGAIALPILMLLAHQPLPYVLFGIVGGIYVIVRHWTNIQRIIAGTEPQLGGQKMAVGEE
jgi:acyl phosphate:glycerol-3-phosphate acyltransferase